MSNVRRWYVYLVSAIALYAVGAAVIGLLSNALRPRGITPIETTALQIAVIIIGLPIYLAHWVWAERLARRDPDERPSAVRQIYLYATLAVFLASALVNVWTMVEALLRVVISAGRTIGRTPEQFDVWSLVVEGLTGVVVWGGLWLYHQQVKRSDQRATGETEWAGSLRRLYLYGFSAAGLVMTSSSLVSLLSRWIDWFTNRSLIAGSLTPPDTLTTLLVGLAVWTVFWLWGQRLFHGPDDKERASTIRKFYLYATIFVAVLTVVTTATITLAALFQRLLGVTTPDPLDLGQRLVIIGVALGVWGYHAWTLRQDARVVVAAPQEAAIRRLYLYLVAGIGLAALLTGLAGDISVVIRSLSGSGLIQDLRDQAAWFTAALLAGLVVWIVPWWQAQAAARRDGLPGLAECRSLVRRIYLYVFLFAATMTVLASAVYVLSILIAGLLGAQSSGNPLSDIAQALAFSLIAVAVWVYHGLLLRGDQARLKAEEARRQQQLRVAVLDDGDGHIGRALLDELRRKLPAVQLDPIGLTPQAVAAMGGADTEQVTTRLPLAQVIVGPWTIVASGVPGGAVSAEVAAAIASSPARKLLIPTAQNGWIMAGYDERHIQTSVQAAAEAIEQIAEGEEVRARRPLTLGAAVAIVALVLCVGPLLLYILAGLVFRF